MDPKMKFVMRRINADMSVTLSFSYDDTVRFDFDGNISNLEELNENFKEKIVPILEAAVKQHLNLDDVKVEMY